MKILNFETNPAFFPHIDFSVNKSVCFICSSNSELALNLLRELIGDKNYKSDEPIAVYGIVDIDNQKYDVCLIHNAEGLGCDRMAVDFGMSRITFSEKRTIEYAQKCRYLNSMDCSVYVAGFVNNNDTRSESTRILESFDAFIEKVESDTKNGDTRPIFIYDFFDHIDESIDINSFLNKLLCLGRQVFISVCPTYPKEKMIHDKVQIVYA